MPLINEPYPGGNTPLWKVLRALALATVFGLALAWYLVNCAGPLPDRAPRHPVPASTGASR